MESIVRVHTQSVGTLFKIKQGNVFTGDTVGGSTPTRDTWNLFILTIVARAEVANLARSVLVLVHCFHDYRVVTPTLERIRIRLIQERLFCICIDVLTINLLFSTNDLVTVKVVSTTSLLS